MKKASIPKRLYRAKISVIVIAYAFTFDVINDLVQYEKKCIGAYIRKRQLFSLGDEQRYCGNKLIEINNILLDLEDLQLGESFQRFREIEYIDKRADDLRKWII